VLIVGADENAWGNLAGPMFVTAVVGDPDAIRCGDSKTYSKKGLHHVAAQAEKDCTAFVTLTGSPRDIAIRGYSATRQWLFWRCIAEARRKVRPRYPTAYIDGVEDFAVRDSQAIKGGDATNPVIGAASCIGKVRQVRYMLRLHARWPEYGFDHNRGYGTQDHIAAIAAHGAIPGVHRIRRCASTLSKRGLPLHFNGNINQDYSKEIT